MQKLTQLYFGFLIGATLSSLFFAFILFTQYTSNNYLDQKQIYRNGRIYKLCEPRKCK